MKFNTISATDVVILREARKILKKLKKRLIKLEEKRLEAVGDCTLDYKAAAIKNYRMLDELYALHVRVEPNDDISLDAQ